MVKEDSNEEKLLKNFQEELARRLRPPWKWELQKQTVAGREAGLDAILDVRDPEGVTHRFAVEVKTALPPARVSPSVQALKHAWPAGPWLIVAPFVGARSRELLGMERVSWIEPGGDCTIAHRALLVEYRGAQRRPRQPETGRRVADLFSGKALRIIRLLLADPARSWMLEEMALAAQASVPFVSRTFATLEDEVYASRRRGATRISQPEALLEAWASASAPEVRVHQYVHLPGPAAFLRRLAEHPPPGRYALTAEAAADQLAPHARFPRVELYVEDLTPWVREERLEPVPRGGNVHLLEAADPGVFDAPEHAQRLTLVCRAQLYVDLFRRGGAAREAADFLRKRGALWPKPIPVMRPEP
jgi:hypothetical protein